MTEREYIIVSDLACVRAAKDAIRRTLPSAYAMDEQDRKVMVVLRQWEERLEAIVAEEVE